MRPSEQVLELAREAGFDLAGIVPLRPPRDSARFEHWLDQGRHAEMTWLERQRERILDPRRVVPEARSLLVVGLGHARAAAELAGGGRVARYAAGADYHDVMTRRLRELARRLEEASLCAARRTLVDAGPLLERSHAAEAGLGFLSKAANLLHPTFGPWFFLGELFLDAELEPSEEPFLGSCGTCRACLDVCPTGAIVAAGEIDSRRCLSYLTIEKRGPIDPELRPDLGDWFFGCDLCSEVCPWGRRAPDGSKAFGEHPALDVPLASWVVRGAEGARHTTGSPLRRARPEGLARNAAIVLGNHPSEQGRIALLQALDRDVSATVREAAGWSLAQGHGREAGVRSALERALGREPSPETRAGLRRSLERSG